MAVGGILRRLGIMADIADNAGDLIDKTEAINIARIRSAAADMPLGYEGECVSCGLESKRLVNDMCAPCRDMTF